MAAAAPSMDLSPPPPPPPPPATADHILLVHSSAPVAFEVDISDAVPMSSSPSVPRRLRKRLLEAVDKSLPSLQEIESRLKEADSRRQRFHEWLAHKARPRMLRSPPPSSQQSEERAGRIRTKLVAAEHKRLELFTQEQSRLARLEELRASARAEVQLRAEREREELESRVESRVQQAEINRLALVEAERQRRCIAHERMAHSMLQRTSQEDRDKERVEALRALIRRKIAAADEKREKILAAEKVRAQAIVLQARKVANAVRGKRELELQTKKESLEARLQRAKRLRAEYLWKRRIFRSNNGQKMKKHGDRLCRKLTSCWRQFRRSRRTTLMLAQDFAACSINRQCIAELPFEDLAARITSLSTLTSVRSLLARFESRFKLSSSNGSNVARIDHLLRRISPPARKSPDGGSRSAQRPASHCQGSLKLPHQNLARNASLQKKDDSSQKAPNARPPPPKSEMKTMARYPDRVFLCAYMIIGHPEAVFSAQGEHEAALSEAASKLIPEFEALLSIILDGQQAAVGRADGGRAQIPSARPFAAQLAEFDAAWCSYLYEFVVWKVQDARSLEEDLVRVAYQLELSMLHKCSSLAECGGALKSRHDNEAIHKQVLEDQQLLRERILHLTGAAGVSRMESAIMEARAQYAEAMEKGNPPPSAFASPQKAKVAPPPPPPLIPSPRQLDPGPPGKGAVNALSEAFDATDHKACMDLEKDENALENEKLLNDMLHEPNLSVFGAMYTSNKAASKFEEIQVQIKETMEDAFWNGILEELDRDDDAPDYRRVVGLLAEMRSELEKLVPEAWREELHECMDVEIFSQVLVSGSRDYEYFRKLLDHALAIVLKLSAPARDEDTKASHHRLVEELAQRRSSEFDGQSKSSFASSLVQGLRFVFRKIQVLKSDISAARIRALAPVLQGSAGIEYLHKAFAKYHKLPEMPPTDAAWCSSKLPKTSKWLIEARHTSQQHEEQLEAARASYRANAPESSTGGVRGIPSSMRTGGNVVVANSAMAPRETAGSNEYVRSLDWKSFQTLVRLGMLKLVSDAKPVTEELVPETMRLNVKRLRNAQNEYQHIIVVVTGLLLLRQLVAGRGVTGPELDHILKMGREQLQVMLLDAQVSVPRIGDRLALLAANNTSSLDSASDRDLMTRLLARSLAPEDTVFRCVSSAICSGLRAILLLGTGCESAALVSAALQHAGATDLQDMVVNLALTLEKLASVSCGVHGPWYDVLVAGLA